MERGSGGDRQNAFRVPVVVNARFEPVDLLEAVLCCVRPAGAGREAGWKNAYNPRQPAAARCGPGPDRAACFEPVDQECVLGVFPAKRCACGRPTTPLDADFICKASFSWNSSSLSWADPSYLQAGRVLQGLNRPTDCPSFGWPARRSGLGARWVCEGPAPAYWHYRQRDGSAAGRRP